MKNQNTVRNYQTDKTHYAGSSSEEYFYIKKNNTVIYLLAAVASILFATVVFYFVFYSHNSKKAHQTPKKKTAINKHDKPLAIPKSDTGSTAATKADNTPLSAKELRRLKAYNYNISYNCSGDVDSRELFAECLGGQSKLEDYISLFDRRAASAKRGMKVTSSLETPPESQGLHRRKGRIKRVYYKGGKTYIDIDYIQWLTDTVVMKNGNDPIETLEASYACIEDGECDKEWCLVNLRLPCMDEGYYIRNKDRNTYTLNVSDTAVIQTEAPDSETDTAKITLRALSRMKDPLCEITIEDNRVIGIKKIYRP